MLEIQSLQHPLVKTCVKLRTSRQFREETGQIFLPGIKLCEEAQAVELLFVEKGYSSPLDIQPTYSVTHEVMKKITGQQHPEPLAAVAPMPRASDLRGKKWLLALDQIRDPGNLGTLLRTALALGWEGVFLSPSCVDPFNDKALRASMGASLRLPLLFGASRDLLQLAQDEQMSLLAADMHGSPLSDHKAFEKIILILGSESHGVSEELKAASSLISIPICGIESLNVAAAGAIFMYNLKS